MGYSHLRDALSVYLSQVRTTKGGADRVAIFSGAQPALDLICRLLLNPGDSVAVENPGSLFPRRTFKMHQAQIIPIPVDKSGIIVEELAKIQSKIKLVYVTPSHQDPTGVSLSMQRRLDLLDWAKANRVIIIEDDFDNEYSYGEKPHPALQGLDTGDTVIYQSSFWKVLYPVVRIGFLILPPQLIEPVRQAKGSIERDLPLLEHVALTEFINGGLLERQIKRLKTRYVRRRAALSHVLARKFRDFVTTGGVSSGMHMILHFDNRLDETDILASAIDAKVPLVSTKGHYIGEGRTHEYMIDFAHSDESQLADIVENWADKLLSTLIQH
jgi:GntR family transcriptional regulator/MocR family aminotransferase